MCGRYTLTDPDPRMLRQRFMLDEKVKIEAEPRFNIAPTDPVLAIRRTPDGSRDAGRLRWGLLPEGFEGGRRPLINARAETITVAKPFRESFEQRRCLIPADGFYEWREDERGKQPLWIALPGNELFAFAGAWAVREDDSGGPIHSCTIITCEPNEAIAPIHNRMPVILPADAEEAWLAPDAGPAELTPFLVPYAGELEMREVNDGVNNVRNDGPELLDPPLKLL
jgi:putative SOS response-associated peptidase YedK